MIPTTHGTLLHRLRSGQSEMAWEDFLAAYQPLLRNWALRCEVPGDDADELLAEIYLHLIPRLRRFTYSPEKRFRGWLKQAVFSAIANYRQKRQREIGKTCDHNAIENASWEDSVEELAEGIGNRLNKRTEHVDAIVAKVKSRIKPVNWQAFLLTYVEGLDCKEAADQLQIPLGKVHVARCRVRAMLTREGQKSLQFESTPLHCEASELV